jgi:serine/threonine protein kinase
MNFDIGNVIDKRFEVEGLCSNSGGMGALLFVKDLSQQSNTKLVLKYCKIDDPEYITRFKREVRLTKKFENNPKVVNILHSNTEFVPPYFVMEYYENGDLTNMANDLKNNPILQEQILCSMIDCIQELHSQAIFHRDIKPQNFLIGEKKEVLVSDFGLGVEPDSTSRFTDTQLAWGTHGYLPPEFSEGGFKYADAKGDIYMLGKSFYTLLSKKSPEHLQSGEFNPILYSVIEKACNLNKDARHHDLEELKQSIIMAYNAILGRGKSPYTEALALLNEITTEPKTFHSYTSEKIISFLQKLAFNNEDEQRVICAELPRPFFTVLIQKEFSKYLENFLKIYQVMVEKADYSFHFAETIAKNMQIIFNGQDVNNNLKALSLEVAVRSAYLMNRYDAMDVCNTMICSVNDNNLGMYVSAVIMKSNYDFIQNIEPSSCKCESIISAISAIKVKE